MFFSIQNILDRLSLLSFEQKLMLIFGIFLCAVIFARAITSKKEPIVEEGDEIYNNKDILGLNKPLLYNEDRRFLNDYPSESRPSIFLALVSALILWIVLFVGISVN